MGKQVNNIEGVVIQCGYYVGVLIVNNHLLSLSTDTFKTNTVIDVSEELTKIWDSKEEKWTNCLDLKRSKSNIEECSDIFYENLKWYKENIEQKYLKPIINVFIHDLHSIGNKELFMKGINEALWDSDVSHYTVIDMKLDTFSGYNITLKKD